MSSRIGWTLAVAGALGVWVHPACAEELSLQAAIARTLQSNPALRAEGAAVSALEHQASLDGLAPAPTIGAELENVAGSGSVSGVRSVEATLRLGQVIELGGKRAARQSRGVAYVERQRNAVHQRRLDLAAEATRRYIAVVEAQEERALAQRQQALAEETQAAVQRRMQRGIASEADATLTQIAVARAEIATEHAEHELASARFALATLWGEAAPVEVEASGELLNLPPLPEFDALAAKLDATPEAQAFLLDAQRIDAERRVAQAAAKPDLSLGLGVRRLEALDDQALVFSFSMPLGTGQRSALAVSRSEAELDAVDARRNAATLEARQTLFARYQELRHARTEVEALSQRMIPAGEHGLSLTRTGYDDARYSILQLTQAQSTLLELQQERLAAAARYHRLLADIERATASAGDTP